MSLVIVDAKYLPMNFFGDRDCESNGTVNCGFAFVELICEFDVRLIDPLFVDGRSLNVSDDLRLASARSQQSIHFGIDCCSNDSLILSARFFLALL
jgi:hypothetical protein